MAYPDEAEDREMYDVWVEAAADSGGGGYLTADREGLEGVGFGQ